VTLPCPDATISPPEATKTTKLMKQIASLLSILLYLTLGGMAQVQPSVSVVGEAEIKIEPDQVQFTFEIVTTDKILATAKLNNDRGAARTLAAVKAFIIGADDIQTDRLTLAPKYSGERTARVLLGYEVTKRILVTLKDLERIDEFLAKVIDAGVNRVVAISIENSQLQTSQEQVRALAVKNARERAVAYAKQLGQTVGKAYVIREEEADTPGYSQGSGSGSGGGVGSGDDDYGSELSSPTAFSRSMTFALGKITVAEKVFVTFELMK
jgi:uncharacterized protein